MVTEVVKKDFFTTEYTEFHGGKKVFRTKTPCSSVYSVVNSSLIVCFGSNRKFLNDMAHNIIRGEYVS